MLGVWPALALCRCQVRRSRQTGHRQERPQCSPEADVRAFCQREPDRLQQPKVIEFRTELPKTPVGKILRRELRDK